ncbi:MAG TPA: HDOD domain-containing protein [Burkholderiaceae bacterium]|nr:HDOD domain-containing protein [Burkholderiaceae bacterium]
MFEFPPRPKREPDPEPISLGAVVPSWSVLVSRDRLRPIGVRLVVRPAARALAAPLAGVLDAVLAGFVAEGATAFPHGLVVVAPVDFGLDASLAGWTAPRNVLLEVAPSALEDDDQLRLLFDVQRQGVRLVLRLDRGPVPSAERLKLFQYVLAADAGFDTSVAPWIALAPPDAAAAAAAFERGAQAVAGWPLPVVADSGGGALQPMQRAVLELIRLVQADADIVDVERTLKTEPVLAYMLLTLANSAAFMPGRAISSLHQAIVMLGYARLVKWLVLLLVIASKGSSNAPLVYGAVARGFALEYLAAAASAPRLQQDEAFIVGAFSLLDAITGQPLAQLVSDVVLPTSICDALLHGRGPHAPNLARAMAFERDGEWSPNAPDAATSGPGADATNASLLQALAATDALLALV